MTERAGELVEIKRRMKGRTVKGMLWRLVAPPFNQYFGRARRSSKRTQSENGRLHLHAESVVTGLDLCSYTDKLSAPHEANPDAVRCPSLRSRSNIP